uniref:Uncharacterized protein n=1 Tax=Ditylenchus dipsaci TaxID=166011 RepID=A0A915CNR5_9BILA
MQIKQLESLLRLSDCYQVKVILNRCSEYLKKCSNNEVSLQEKLLYAQSYHLSELLEYCIKEFKTFDDVKKLRLVPISLSAPQYQATNP